MRVERGFSDPGVNFCGSGILFAHLRAIADHLGETARIRGLFRPVAPSYVLRIDSGRSACEKPERARAFSFSVESGDASFDSLSVGDSDKHRALDVKLADALLKIVKGDLARRLAVMSETLAKRGLVLAGR